MRVCVPCPQNSFWLSNKFLFLAAWPSGLLFEESPKSIQDFIGNGYCPGEKCFNREKCESLDGFLLTPRSIYGCGRYGAWLFVHKVCFTLHEHISTTKIDKTRSFIVNNWTCYPTIICSKMNQFIQPNIKRKYCVWRTKYNRLLEVCIVQHVELKRVFRLQTLKRRVSTTLKSTEPAATFWKFLWRTKSCQLFCLVAMAHIALSKRRVVTTKLENHFLFEKIFRPITTNHTWTWAQIRKNPSI